MGFFEPLAVGRGGDDALIVNAPMTMKFGKVMKLDVFH